jgi:NTE family protein
MHAVLVLSGGAALGAYHAGAYAALHERRDLSLRRVAGSSVGAVMGALIAGNPAERRVARLQQYWSEIALDQTAGASAWLAPFLSAQMEHACRWMSVLYTRLFGRPGAFRVRLPGLSMSVPNSLYDLAPLRENLERLIDFDRLNRQREVELSVTATDIETGDEVTFDTRRKDRIGPEHLLASSGFMPAFEPMEIDGRLLGDGSLAAHAPVGSAFPEMNGERDLLCFVVDAFPNEGKRPATLEQAAARSVDLLFANQRREAVARFAREYRMRRTIARLAARPGAKRAKDREAQELAIDPERSMKILELNYRAPPHEAGPEKIFDFSRAALSERWEAGYLDMQEAIELARGDADGKGERGVRMSLLS